MENLFNQRDADACMAAFPDCPEVLALRVYTSRLLGKNRRLVLHGGGNTSVKMIGKDLFEADEAVLFIKGSGRDLSTIDPEGFAELNLTPLRRLRRLSSISDRDMENQLRIHKRLSRTPNPSVETLLHAFLPHKYVDHTHADGILILTNQKNGDRMVREALGESVCIIPYIMSGFPLAKAVMEQVERHPRIDAVVIMHHGLFTFAEDAETSYGKMIHYADRAEAYIENRLKSRRLTALPADTTIMENARRNLSRCTQIIRGVCARVNSNGILRRLIVETRCTPDLIAASLSGEARALSGSGVLTPDHVIRTKNHMVFIESIPEDDTKLKNVVSRAVEGFKADYRNYLQARRKTPDIDLESLDADPVLFFIVGGGLVALGKTRKDAIIAADIGEHTLLAKRRGFALGDYAPVSEDHIYHMEYWPFQKKKLEKEASHLLQGQVAVVTGGGGAVGYGIADRLLAAGAVVVVADINPSRLNRVYAILVGKYGAQMVEHITFDVRDFQSVETAFNLITRKVGGIDIVVPNAGIAHVATIEDLDPDRLDAVIDVNLKGTFTVIKAAIPIFRRQGTGGNIVVISSKNVFDPGAAFGAYSASKAGAHQIAKIAALEMAELNVRVNMVNPDAVFGDEHVCSGLWALIGPDRMKSRGLDAEGLQDYYCRRSLLKVPVSAEQVGNAVVFFAAELTPTTGAALPVDAGNPSTFSR